jgi:hypothetical protein
VLSLFRQPDQLHGQAHVPGQRLSQDNLFRGKVIAARIAKGQRADYLFPEKQRNAQH